MTVVIGLTGGIASGKSVVSSMLAQRGALVIDADEVGHDAYRPGSDCYRAVIDAFGEAITRKGGEIDRKALGAKVFSDPAERRRLEAIVWPWMRGTMERRLAELRREGQAVVVLEAAVLLEADWTPLVDAVWVVTAPPAQARERMISRNGLTAGQADARIAAQLTNEQRSRRADVTIDNSGTLEQLEERVAAAWQRLGARVTSP